MFIIEYSLSGPLCMAWGETYIKIATHYIFYYRRRVETKRVNWDEETQETWLAVEHKYIKESDLFDFEKVIKLYVQIIIFLMS